MVKPCLLILSHLVMVNLQVSTHLHAYFKAAHNVSLLFVTSVGGTLPLNRHDLCMVKWQNDAKEEAKDEADRKWKAVVEDKDAEIAKLKEQLKAQSSH